jgi:hypothetical protein
MDSMMKCYFDLFTTDVERIVFRKRILHSIADVEEKWRIGQRIAQEEILHSKKEDWLLSIQGLSTYLSGKYGETYSSEKLNLYYLFYLGHLNLFDSLFYSRNRILDWSDYVKLLGIKNEGARKKMEEKMLSSMSLVQT